MDQQSYRPKSSVSPLIRVLIEKKKKLEVLEMFGQLSKTCMTVKRKGTEWQCQKVEIFSLFGISGLKDSERLCIAQAPQACWSSRQNFNRSSSSYCYHVQRCMMGGSAHYFMAFRKCLYHSMRAQEHQC